ncbi:nucleoside-diphosphate kinase [Croceicoccus ponticola]|uniref:Nucleoside-diphosphate kinase n=1 Tax=Croceicoccus ponticola TaxID=2217664 RepID=A0A437H0U9_9SPHN|nr:GreA/GreB family elongation factor [Croceicoccus ponticola]RVQ69196.1 nucleoside-diphosphate kinase [Croceicoccus ponticola]
MSVAFRRESDEEHLEPKFARPIPPGPNLVTARGLALIESKVVEFELLLPNLSDEGELTAAKRDLKYWRTRHATAQIVEPGDGTSVAFGSTVGFRMNGQDRSITIVGDDEAEPAAGLLSFSAPLSRAMIDAEVGDMIDFANKAEAIEILSIR